jgi:chemotaxis protein CheZ
MTGEGMPGLAQMIAVSRERSQTVRRVIDLYCREEAAGDAGGEAQQAVGRLRPTQLREQRIPAAIAELSEIRDHSERSANIIMERAELLMASVAVDATQILEACTFQDIIGQRIGKVVELLQTMDGRLHGLIRETGIEDDVRHLDDDELAAELRRKELLLNGPQLAAEAMDQDAIDALLGA